MQKVNEMVISRGRCYWAILWFLLVFTSIWCSLGVTHAGDDTPKKTFGDLISIGPDYAGDLIFGRTKKEGALLEYIQQDLATNDEKPKAVRVLYLHSKDIDNLQRRLAFEEGSKVISLDYFSYSVAAGHDIAFVFLEHDQYQGNLDLDKIELIVLVFDTKEQRWRLQGEQTGS